MLIMAAGLRGFSIGGASVSEKHCGFVINHGNATSADILEVISEVQERVYNRFDIKLEPEVIYLGDF
jgi:UDP-N-acetylmuramate dehydrogenase